MLKDTPTTLVVDAHDGMGMVASHKAMTSIIEKAKTYGMGMAAIRNSTHYGIAGYWATMASKQGMIGIAGTNARPSIAPTFGVENMLGTNPLTFAIPTDEEFPFVLDCVPPDMTKTVEILAREVINGKWGNGNARRLALTSAGYDYDVVQRRVNEILAPKSVDVLAREVIIGKWGNGELRKRALTNAGYDYNEVQKRVNQLLGVW